MGELLGMVHMCRMGLLWGWWWPVDPKLVFDQMTAPAPEIMDQSYNYHNKYTSLVVWSSLFEG
jgi:hypothetical protein